MSESAQTVGSNPISWQSPDSSDALLIHNLILLNYRKWYTFFSSNTLHMMNGDMFNKGVLTWNFIENMITGWPPSEIFFAFAYSKQHEHGKLYDYMHIINRNRFFFRMFMIHVRQLALQFTVKQTLVSSTVEWQLQIMGKRFSPLAIIALICEV